MLLHHDIANMQILIGSTSDPSDEEATASDLAALKARVAAETRALGLSARISRDNLGSGADWIVSVIEVAAGLGAALFAIPEAHKRIRESVEECKKIHSEIIALMDRLRGHSPVVRQPVEALYLLALEKVLRETDAAEITLLSSEPIPLPAELSNGFHALQHYLFAFQAGHELVLVAINTDAEILWARRIAQNQEEHKKPVGDIFTALQSEEFAIQVGCAVSDLAQLEADGTVFSVPTKGDMKRRRYPGFQLNSNLDKELLKTIVSMHRDAVQNDAKLWGFLRSPHTIFAGETMIEMLLGATPLAYVNLPPLERRAIIIDVVEEEISRTR